MMCREDGGAMVALDDTVRVRSMCKWDKTHGERVER